MVHTGRSFDNAINDPTILLDKFILPEDGCNNLVEGIRLGTACAVLDGPFDAASPIGPAGSSAVILVSSISCHKKIGQRAVTGLLVLNHHNLLIGAS